MGTRLYRIFRIHCYLGRGNPCRTNPRHISSRIIYLLIQCAVEQLALVLSVLEEDAPPVVGAAPEGVIGVTINAEIRMHI